MAPDQTSSNADQPVTRNVGRARASWVLHALLTLCVVVAGALLAGRVAREMAWHIAFPYEIKGWAEGHFLYNALQLSRGENIYVDPDKHPITLMFYGFLYPVVMAPLVRWFGPELWIPRIVSALASVLSLVWVYRTSARRAGSPVAGGCGVLLALGGYCLSDGCWDWGHSDALFVVLGLASLASVERSEGDHAWRRVLLAAALSCASCCAKQTGAAFMVAIAASLFLRQRRLAGVYVIACTVMMTAIWTAGHFLTGGMFERYMVMDLVVSHPFHPPKIPILFALILTGVPILVIASAWQIQRDLRRTGWGDPIVWAFLWVGLASMLSYSRLKGGLNSLMPLFFLLSVPAGVGLSQMIAANGRVASKRSAALVLLTGQLLLSLLAFSGRVGSERKQAAAYLRAGELIEAELRDPNERVLMLDRISFAVRAGRPIYDGVSLAKIGVVNDRLKAQFADQFFDKILVAENKLFGLRPDVLKVMFARYRKDHVIQEDLVLRDYTPMLVFKAVRSGRR